MSETLIFGPVSVKFRSINSIQFPVEALSTFYHLKSLIALPIQMIRMIRTFGGGGVGVTPPYPLKFRPCTCSLQLAYLFIKLYQIVYQEEVSSEDAHQYQAMQVASLK